MRNGAFAPRGSIGIELSRIRQSQRVPANLSGACLRKENMKLYVGNLPYKMSEQSLRNLFSRHGQVESIWMGNTRVGSPHGYGFVHMADGPTAEKAITMLDGLEFEGSPITVHRARD